MRKQRKNALDEFMTTNGGTRIATSVGGPLTGRGGDYLIIDDPLKPDEALSATKRHNVNQWYDSTLYSRLDDKMNGCIIIIMQRLHEDDLVGYVLNQEGWKLLSLPAIAHEDELHTYQSILGHHTYARSSGELLHRSREPLSVLERQRSILGEYHFAGQYQQCPAPMGGGLIKTTWFEYYDSKPCDYDRIVQSWDTANNVYRHKLEFPDLKRAVISQDQAYSPHIILIEDKASGTQLLQNLRYDGMNHIHAVKPDHDKIMRAHAQTPVIENGMVYLPKESSWKSEFLHEISRFPNGKYDDQVDSMSQFLTWAAVHLRPSHYRIRVL